MEEKFIKAGEASRYLGCTRQHLIDMSAINEIPTHVIGYGRDGRKKRRYLKSELDAYKNILLEKSILRTGGK